MNQTMTLRRGSLTRPLGGRVCSRQIARAAPRPLTGRVAISDAPQQSWASGASWLAPVVSSLILLSGSPSSAVELNRSEPLYDGARILLDDRRDELNRELQALEERTGYRVRIITHATRSDLPDEGSIRRWAELNKQTVVVDVDVSRPTMFSFPYIGDNVLQQLRRPWWNELAARFGNRYFVNESGERAALNQMAESLVTCLGRPEGCRVVPGVSDEQFTACLTTSILGGLVAGSVVRIDPQGFVQRRWVWLLLFSPLWASLFISFGLGPIVSRTSDLTPVAVQTAAFLASAALPTAGYELLKRRPQGGQQP